MKKPNISVLIPTRNEEDYIESCLKSIADWADEIIVVDTGSTDSTLKKIKRIEKAKIFQTPPGGDYSTWRNMLWKKSACDWIFYLDADETASQELKNEINNLLANNPRLNAYAIPRVNFLLDKPMMHGGWYPDYVKRLFKRTTFHGWTGGLHEEPHYSGELGMLTSHILHDQPKTLEPMFEKSIKWSVVEARLLYESQHPPVVWWRILRMGLTVFVQRVIQKQGYRDGVRGVILNLYQVFHTMIVYMRVQEFQKAKGVSFY